MTNPWRSRGRSRHSSYPRPSRPRPQPARAVAETALSPRRLASLSGRSHGGGASSSRTAGSVAERGAVPRRDALVPGRSTIGVLAPIRPGTGCSRSAAPRFRVPSWPSPGRPCASWKARTARRVARSKIPFTSTSCAGGDRGAPGPDGQQAALSGPIFGACILIWGPRSGSTLCRPTRAPGRPTPRRRLLPVPPARHGAVARRVAAEEGGAGAGRARRRSGPSARRPALGAVVLEGVGEDLARPRRRSSFQYIWGRLTAPRRAAGRRSTGTRGGSRRKGSRRGRPDSRCRSGRGASARSGRPRRTCLRTPPRRRSPGSRPRRATAAAPTLASASGASP